jgi:hypothetical protein
MVLEKDNCPDMILADVYDTEYVLKYKFNI